LDWLAPTILVSLLACVLCVVCRPGTALGIVFASALLWPEYLRIPMGLAQMSAPRLAALVLFVRMLCTSGLPTPRWRWLDSMVIVSYVWLVVANVIADSPEAQLRTMIGSGFDTLLMYLMARRVFAAPSEAPRMVWGLVISALVLAPLAFLENASRWSPWVYALLSQFGLSLFKGGGSEVRWGMFRAFSSTQVPIFFGLAMMLVAGLLFSFRQAFRPRWLLYLGLVASICCVFSSLSSGPWLSLLVVAGLSVFYWQRRLIMPAIVGAVLMIGALEALSNRHFYHLIDRLSMGSDNAYYRSRLMEVAVNHIDEYWAFGAGGSSLEDWGQEIDGRGMVDMVNNYIIVACYGGLLALLFYLIIKVGVLYCLVRAFKTGSPGMRPITFGLGTLFLGLSVCEVSVGIYGPALLFSYVLMGCSVSTVEWAEQWTAMAPSRRAAAAKEKLSARGMGDAGAGADAAGVGDNVVTSGVAARESVV
jgi:hypothetical protein